MSAMAVSRSFECAPHAARSVAMAMTLALNFAIVLYALLPSTPYPIRTPPPLAMTATVVPPLPAPVPAPVVPPVPVAPHVHVAATHAAVVHPLVQPTIATQAVAVASHDAAIAIPVASGVHPANTSASVAYETATAPDYPIMAAREGVQGTVLLQVLVDAGGVPVEVKVEKSSGSRLLDDAARRHVLAAWRFHPAIRDGRAVQTWALVPVRFSLNRG